MPIIIRDKLLSDIIKARARDKNMSIMQYIRFIVGKEIELFAPDFKLEGKE